MVFIGPGCVFAQWQKGLFVFLLFFFNRLNSTCKANAVKWYRVNRNDLDMAAVLRELVA